VGIEAFHRPGPGVLCAFHTELWHRGEYTATIVWLCSHPLTQVFAEIHLQPAPERHFE